MTSSSVRLAAALPAGDRNGLAAIAHALVDDPSSVHVAIVLLDCSRLTTSVDDGSTLPTARIRAIEPISEGPDATELRRLLRRAVEKRTGMTELPLELERALDELGVHAELVREPDARERAAGDRDDRPGVRVLGVVGDRPDDADPGEPERPLPGLAHDPTVDAPDEPDPADELAADDPRRNPMGSGGLFREAPITRDDDEEGDQ